MMGQKLISVIVPAYNAEGYIERCIRSILNQTFQDIEVIIVDDGSQDGTYGICEKLKKQDQRINIIRQENAGVSEARNKGLEVASGQFIMFVDADDWLDTNYIEVMVLNMSTNDQVVVSNFVEDYLGKQEKREYDKINEERVVSLKEEIFKDFISEKIYTYVVWAKLYRSDVIKKHRFEQLSYSEDAIFTRKVLSECTQIRLIDNEGYHYYIGVGVTSRKNREKEKLFGALKMLAVTDELISMSQTRLNVAYLEEVLYQTYLALLKLYYRKDDTIEKQQIDLFKKLYGKVINYSTRKGFARKSRLRLMYMKVLLDYHLQKGREKWKGKT